jgi:hypothetical protein
VVGHELSDVTMPLQASAKTSGKENIPVVGIEKGLIESD